MGQEDQLQEMTEEFLLSLISGISDSLIDASKVTSPFQELGIDSFHVLQVIRRLETHFGTLSKTLLFENFTIRDLANYFVVNHRQKLQEQLEANHFARSPKTSKPTPPPASEPANASKPAVVATPAGRHPILILEREALTHPHLGPLVSDLFQAHKNEGSVSRGTRNIAPNLFIGSARRGFFNYGRNGDLLLAYAYTGPDDYFPELAQELIQHCREKNLEFNLFTDNRIEAIGGKPFTATPFGAVQRILDLQRFTLQGGKMRRLRYQVSKFSEAGKARTIEYRCGSNPDTDRQIAEIIDRWCSGKTMINPLIHVVKEEILAGKLAGDHRIFLTYLDEILQNAILISPMSRQRHSYLMDLEFYPKEMPLGGLEFAIAEMIGILVAEGTQMLSLGATFGVKIGPSENADARIESILDRLREQGIFNDEGNLQFKNKFRTENKSIFLCRALEGSNPDNITDIILMIADPGRNQIPDTANHTAFDEATTSDHVPAIVGVDTETPRSDNPREPSHTPNGASMLAGIARSAHLVDAGFNPHNISASLVEFDLRTDSWSQLESPFVERQKLFLQANVQQSVDYLLELGQVFPFRHLSLTQSGRSAERAFFQAWKRKGEIIENLLFPTTIFHQIEGGFEPKELAYPEIFKLGQSEFHRGGLDCDALQERVRHGAASIAMVCVELSANGAGGYPVSVKHLRKIKSILDPHSIPLVLDATRVLENAAFAEEGVHGVRAQNLRQAARDLMGMANAVIASLTKDFCVTRGGIIATDDTDLHREIEAIIAREGLGLDPVEKRHVGLALQDEKQIQTRILRRLENVRLIGEALELLGVPMLKPSGTHCVILDVQRMESFRSLPCPVASFLAWLYLTTGIRAGALSTGMRKSKVSSGLVRLAVPVGLTRKSAQEIAQRLASAFGKITDIPILVAETESTTPHGEMHSRYALSQYIEPTSNVIPRSDWTEPSRASEAEAATTTARNFSADGHIHASMAEGSSAGDEIAIIGMAGRYPKAANLQALWENLLQKRDCIEDLPPERLHQRRLDSKRYRGGFLADIDRFDSLFFNISPREAEIMDPQERLFLEVAWEALEDAGYFPDALAKDASSRNVGVYVGAVWTMYQLLSAEGNLATSGPVHANSFLWSIANRVSYWMNFTGPSLTLDTACSSSLTALYLACEALKRGECTSAIVGGVNLDLHQHKYDINSGGGALSIDGVCRSFGKGANGYVAGEGVGAIVLKPLRAALRDRDNVHGIIKGAAINHGGKTGGYTVPSPNAQADLIVSALRRAKVDARRIDYIEAHGTGTQLGDPIEISGLKKAFDAYGVTAQSCSIGSIKTNIGHLEAAAGIVAVSKVLLQIKHRRLVPSLHSEELNEHIDFATSPFRVQQALEPFTGKEMDGESLPLLCGVSSFGAGGANAHVIIQEPPSSPQEEPDAELDTPEVFVLSARSESQLVSMAGRLRDFLLKDAACDEPSRGIRIRDIAFTLQVGRKPFDHRLATIARSKQELLAKLDDFLAGRTDRDILSGRVKINEGIFKLLNREEREEFVKLVTRSGDPLKMAQIWVEGLVHSWPSERGSRGRRISLPTYPFADERHWIRRPTQAPSAFSPSVTTMHPLVHQNHSDLYRQCYTSDFHAGDRSLSTVRIGEQRFLSPFTFLELARAATAHALAATGEAGMTLTGISWGDLLPIDSPVRLEIAFTEADGGLCWEIKDRRADDSTVLHWGEVDDGPVPQVRKVHVSSLRANLEEVPLQGDGLARHLAEWGVAFAGSSCCVTSMCHGGDQLLASIRLPDDAGILREGLLLHPEILDGALQAALWLLCSQGLSSRMPLLPSAVEALHILSPIPDHAYAHVRLRKTSAALSPSSPENPMVDIDLCDLEGRVCVSLRGLSLGLPTFSEIPAGSTDEAPTAVLDPVAAPITAAEELLFAEDWEEMSPQPVSPHTGPAPHIIFADEDFRSQVLANHPKGSFDRSIFVLPGERFHRISDQEIIANPNSSADLQMVLESAAKDSPRHLSIAYAWAKGKGRQGIHGLFKLFSAIRDSNTSVQELLLVGHYNLGDASTCWDYSWIGFERSLAIHFPTMRITIMLCENQSEVAAGMKEISGQSGIFWCKNARWHRLASRPLPPLKSAPAAMLKQNGAYLITGGLGALGFHFARHLANQCGARLLLIGRRAHSPEIEERLASLRAEGALDAQYRSVDLGRAEDIRELARQLPFPISGVFHAAGIESPKLFHEKTEADIDSVMVPKTIGTQFLDEAMADQPLDFTVYFSSSSAILGDGGACDYAIANRFLMAYGRFRSQVSGDRHKTIVINWPLWKDGGMGMTDPAQIDFYLKSSGQALLETDRGLRVWQEVLASELPQALLLLGDAKRLTNAVQRFYQPRGLTAQSAAPSIPSEAGGGWKPQFEGMSVRACLLWDTKRIISAQLKIPVERLDEETVLTDYGFESIGLADFAQKLSNLYSVQVTPDVFFTYSNLTQLADYFEENHKEAVAAFYQKPATGSDSIPPASRALPATTSVSTGARGQATATPPRRRKRASRSDDRIAIVGMAGRFPGARDVDGLWSLISEGRHAVQEVPSSRWDWRKYFTAPGHPGNVAATNQAGFIEGVSEFDEAFFGFSSEEADWTDPGQRLLLMEAYHAIEDAGIRPSSLRGKKIGVYVGMEESQYGLFAEGLANEHVMATNGAAMISSRLSYCLDLRGPAISVNTACSSGLVALHHAAMAIRNGDCEAALVGALALLLTPATFIAMGATGMLSADGRCHSLGNRDDGMGLGEAVAVVMLKPLAAAQADGDNIYGVLRASAVNFDGKTNGITAPNGRAQSDLVETVYRANGIPITSLDVIATHSTGTKLGDSIEINALVRAIRNLKGATATQDPGDSKVFSLTCNKGNLGHTLAASGLVSLVTLLKGMRHEVIPASLNCETENEYVAWKDMPFRIQKESVPWIGESGRPRLAATSAFGRSGTNAHVVLEECRHTRAPIEPGGRAFIPISAKTSDALAEKVRDLARFIRTWTGSVATTTGSSSSCAFGLAEIAFTLQTGRDHLEERAAVAVDSLADLLDQLEAYNAGPASASRWHRANAKEYRQNHGLQSQDPSAQTATIDRWFEEGDVANLLDSWTKGLEIDWSRFYGGILPRKISLPGYPFARNRHWIDHPEPATGFPESSSSGPASPASKSGTSRVSRSADSSSPEREAVGYTFLKPGDPDEEGPSSELDALGKAECFVRQALAEQLDISPDAVDLDAELADTGITSKDMVQITVKIKDLIDPSFVPTAFFDCTTTRSFAMALAAKNPEQLDQLRVRRTGSPLPAEIVEVVQAERRSPAAGVPAVSPSNSTASLHVQDAKAWKCISIPSNLPRDYDNPRAILLTGATGYLGIHLLSELLDENPGLRVYCLVRASHPKNGLDRILSKAGSYRLRLDTDRVSVLCGDITRPNLGLTESEWEFCCREMQQIVHASAHVNHIEGYATFRASTRGMLEIIRLAGSHRLKLVHFISSIAACTFFDGKQLSIHEQEAFIEDGQAVFGGYGQSKWVQESLLKEAHAQGLPFVIYRFGELGGSGLTGLAQTEDMVHRLLQMRLALGVREKISNDVLDMLPVDFAARVVARACTTERTWNHILHATHPKPCPMSGFYSFAEKQGYSFKLVSRADYLAKCMDYIQYVGSSNAVDAFILECVVMREVIGLARNMRAMDGYFVVLFPFDQSQFLECLEAEGLQLPAWEQNLELYFRNWNAISTDFFARIDGFSQWQISRVEESCAPKAELVSSISSDA